jgi:hypothetical protein
MSTPKRSFKKNDDSQKDNLKMLTPKSQLKTLNSSF